MTVKKITLLFCILAGLAAGTAHAAKKYVSDNLIITLRSGDGSQHKVVKTITTGTPMEILEERADTGYSRARLEDGTEGWVRTQYLTDKPVAQALLDRLQVRYDKLRESQQAQKTELDTLKAELARLNRDNQKMEKDNKSMQDRMTHINTVAAKPILLDKENRELKEQNVILVNEKQLLSQENQILKDRSSRDWFIAGGGVMLVGILLGLILPKLGWRKKNSWSSGGL
ncbi:MAG: TIGR04211 family SH3 domain-containing protein [Gammaproteobacteria bacterium]|nr:TIGR04211 family SH3 domain-containing protein [Gammaproteobacteria bacterium]